MYKGDSYCDVPNMSSDIKEQMETKGRKRVERLSKRDSVSLMSVCVRAARVRAYVCVTSLSVFVRAPSVVQ